MNSSMDSTTIMTLLGLVVVAVVIFALLFFAFNKIAVFVGDKREPGPDFIPMGEDQYSQWEPDPPETVQPSTVSFEARGEQLLPDAICRITGDMIKDCQCVDVNCKNNAGRSFR